MVAATSGPQSALNSSTTTRGRMRVSAFQITVEVEGEQVDVARKSMCGDLIVNGLGRNPGAHKLWRPDTAVCGRGIEGPTALDQLGVAIEQQSIKSVIEDQISNVAFNTIARANLENHAVGRTDQRKNVE